MLPQHAATARLAALQNSRVMKGCTLQVYLHTIHPPVPSCSLAHNPSTCTKLSSSAGLRFSSKAWPGCICIIQCVTRNIQEPQAAPSYVWWMMIRRPYARNCCLCVCFQVLHEKPTLVAHWLACDGRAKMAKMMKKIKSGRAPTCATVSSAGLQRLVQRMSVLCSAATAHTCMYQLKR